MNDIIDSLFVALGFKVDPSGLEELKEKTEGLKKHVLALGSIFTGAAIGIGLLVEHVASGMGDLYSFAELNNVTARSVAALGKVATDNAAGSLDSMKSTIQSLNNVIGQASLGVGRGAMTFKKLGMEAKNADHSVKTVDQILAEVSDRMTKMSRQEQIALAEKLGIDPQFVKVMSQGSVELARLREEAEAFNPMTEEQYKLADEVDKLFIKAKATVGVFTKMVGASLLPVMKQVLTTYMGWFKEVRSATSGVVIDGLKALVAVMGTVWDWAVRIVTVGKHLYDWMTQFAVVTYAAAFALGVFASVKVYNTLVEMSAAIRKLVIGMSEFDAAALIIPAIIGAIAIAIGLIIDDFVTWKEGGDSVIGDLVKKFPILLDVINAVGDAFSSAQDYFLDLWQTLEPALGKLAASFGDLFRVAWPIIVQIFKGWAMILAVVLPYVVEFFALVIQGWANIFALIVDGVAAVIDAFATVFSAFAKGFEDAGIYAKNLWDSLSSGFNGVVDSLKAVWDGFVGYWMEKFDKIKDAVKWVGSALGLGDSSVSATVASSASPALTGPGSATASMAGGGSSINTSSTKALDQSTNISGGLHVTVVSPDPAKAGEAVVDTVAQANKAQTRNTAGAVRL